jgi:CheY-like chemotaxis protein
MGTPLALLDAGTHMTFKEEAMDTTAKFKGIRAAGPQSRELRVLLAEDDAAQREAMAEFLTSHGFKVETAGDGINAVEMALQKTFDVVVSDIRLPGLSGLGIARLMRSAPLPPPVVLITAYPEWWNSPEAYASRVRRVLIKPFSLTELVRALEDSVNQDDRHSAN